MSDPKSEPGDTGSDSPAEAEPAAPAADTVAANVDAPAQAAPRTEAEVTPTETGIETETETATASDDRPSAADTVAANVDAPAETPPAAEAPPGTPQKRRNPWPTVGTVVAVLLVLAGIGYFGGLGPLNRLSTTRDLDPPDQVSGLNRITDAQTRERFQLDATRDALRRINDGKKATVEAYGDPAGDRLFMVIALRGKVDIDKEIRDSGASGDQVKKVGKSTCATSVQDIPTSCYRGSNTLTVIAQGLTSKVDVNAVGAVSDEAFDAMK
jgi:hypothetical protein